MKKDNISTMRSLSMISQFGINMIVPIFMCSFVGIMLDKWLNTSFIMIVLFFVGAIAGGRNIYILIKRMHKDSDRGENPYVSRIER